MKSTGAQTDLRVRRTHKFLWEALMAELSERAFEDITVRDICKRAMVHRTTFYKHYEDKYALLEQGMRQMYKALLIEGHDAPQAFTLDNPPPYFIRLFEHVEQHQRFYKLMLCGEGISRFQRLIREYVAEIVSNEFHQRVAVNQPFAFPVAMQAQFFAGAVLGLLTWWLEQDMPLSPLHMAQYLLSVHNTLPSHV